MNYSIRKEWPILLILVISFIVGIILYPHMPDRMPIHWNVRGEVDGYGSKMFGLFGLPLINVGMYLLLIVLPKIDPKRDNYMKFNNAYLAIRYVLHIFFALLFALTIFVSIGYQVNIGKWIAIALAVLFIIMGFNIGKVKHNYFVGFRLPWTLADEEVWERTHKLGAKLMVAGGLAALIGAIFTDGFIMFVILMVGLLLPAIIAGVYSYFIYRNIMEQK